MALGKLLIGFAVLSMFAVGGVFVFMAAGEEAHLVDHSVENEITTVTLDEWNELGESNVVGATYDDDEVIRNDSDGVLVEGTDYEWNTSTGEIRPLSGTDATTTLNATYNYSAPSEGTQTGLVVVPDLWLVVGVVGILFAVLLLIGAVVLFVGGLA